MSSNILNTVRQFLATHHMFVSNDWLSGCVEYLCEDSNNTEADIKRCAREQWLLNDLKEICPGSLPVNLKDQRKTVLNGRFVLQINAAMDIGTPAYQQNLKLQKVNMENVEATSNYEDKISSHRMMKLYLTDGVQEITGMEYRPMRNLSCDITPGCKILIKGPVECRRGMLLLTEGAIELLGGEVGELSVSNSLAGLLSAKLGLPMTQAADLNPTVGHPRNATIPTPHSEVPPPALIHEPPVDHRPVARVTSRQASGAFFDDDTDIDIDELAEIEAQITDVSTKRQLTNALSNPEKKIKIDLTTNVNTPNIDLTTNVNTPEIDLTTNVNAPKIDLTTNVNAYNIDLTTNVNASQIDLITNVNAAKIDLTSNVNTVEDYPDDNDVFFDEDEDYLREMEAVFDAGNNEPCTSINKGPIPLSVEPYVYIKQINDLPDSKRLGRVFNVKGQIMKLLSKLSVGKDGWTLKCTIVDGTGSIDVDFTSQVLSELVGFTPQEMYQLKKDRATKPELDEKIICALKKIKDNLQVLYCIIELTMLEVPTITCLTAFNATHAMLQRQRIEGSGL